MDKKPRFLLIHGSVWGRAESIADLIEEEAISRGLCPIKCCMSEYEDKFDLSNEPVVVIVSSTTGDGDQPQKAEALFRKLKNKNLDSDYLKDLQYSILGLGNSNYSQFCNGPKSFHKVLSDLGAKTFYDPDWADDGVGLELVVEPWIEGLWDPLIETLKHSKEFVPKTINEKLVDKKSEIQNDLVNKDQDIMDLINKVKGIQIESDTLVSDSLISTKRTLPSVPVRFLQLTYDDAKYVSSNVKFASKFPLSDTEIGLAEVKSIKKLTNHEDVKKSFLITLDLSQTQIQCQPGDAIGIICPNTKEEVETLLKRIGVSSEKCDKIVNVSLIPDCGKKSAKVPDFLPQGINLNEIFTWHLDIRSVPKKPLVRALCEWTKDEKQKAKIEYLSSKEGATTYLKEIRGASLSILDLLLIFDSCHPPVELLLEHLPRLQARAYSAASIQNNGLIDIVFNIIDIPRSKSRVFDRFGLCTHWMASWLDKNLNDIAKINVYGRNNKSFRHPEDLDKNIIMIGPGTGVAPFIGFLQLREKLLLETKPEKPGISWLFYGCRYQDKDYLFKEEISRLKDSNVLTNLDVCFSREEDNQGIKYVQDKIRLNEKEFIKLLDDDKTMLYVCGDADNMAKDVNDCIIQSYVNVKGISLQEAKNIVADLMMQKRYQQDIWS